MRPTEKLMLVAGLGQSAYSRWKLQRLLSVAITVTMLAVIAAVLVSAVVLSGFYVAYLYLIAHGANPLQAWFVTGLILMLCIAGMMVVIRHHLSGLKFPASPVGDVVDAFFDGLFSK